MRATVNRSPRMATLRPWQLRLRVPGRRCKPGPFQRIAWRLPGNWLRRRTRRGKEPRAKRESFPASTSSPARRMRKAMLQPTARQISWLGASYHQIVKRSGFADLPLHGGRGGDGRNRYELHIGRDGVAYVANLEWCGEAWVSSREGAGYATGCGKIKLAYDFATYAGSLAGCAVGIIKEP